MCFFHRKKKEQHKLMPQLIRVTTPTDGEFLNRIYSYWPNAWLNGEQATVFVGHVDGQPRFFQVKLDTGQVLPMGSLLPYTGTGEGWYWTTDGRIMLCNGNELIRIDPFSPQGEVVMRSDPGTILWQAHSSDDGQTHSATVKQVVNDGAYPSLGTLVTGPQGASYWPAKGALDESQVTNDGKYLVIKEDNYNRVITVATGEERTITDADGAVGHSDVGPSMVVGEDDQHGACVKWDLDTMQRTELFQTWNMGHVSVQNGVCLLSDSANLSLVGLDGSGVTPLQPHGMTGSGYDHQVFANLDRTGQVACFVSNMGTDRFDMYLLRL